MYLFLDFALNINIYSWLSHNSISMNIVINVGRRGFEFSERIILLFMDWRGTMNNSKHYINMTKIYNEIIQYIYTCMFDILLGFNLAIYNLVDCIIY